MKRTARILVTGAHGRLGAAFVRQWSVVGYEVIGLGRAQLDLSWHIPQLRSVLARYDFDILVNCAAQTNVDRCEQEADEAFVLNAEAPTILASIAHQRGARVIHISTDYVFSGEKREPYTEDDAAQPISIYGASKRTGEAGVLTATEGRALVVRVSWVFGPDRPSFVDGVIRNAMENEHVVAIADKVASPTSALDAARALNSVLMEDSASGVLHLCNQGSCTWQEYGQHAVNCAQALGVPLKTCQVSPTSLAEMSAFVARRPVYSAMNTDKIRLQYGISMASWESALEQYIAEKYAVKIK